MTTQQNDSGKLTCNLRGVSQREINSDVLFLGTIQDNNNSSETSYMTEAESLVCYIVSNFKCGNFNGELENASEVLRNTDQWLQEKERLGSTKSISNMQEMLDDLKWALDGIEMLDGDDDGKIERIRAKYNI